jgi:hypothetical protein
MSKNIDVEVKSKKTEKNWAAGPKDKNKNRHTIEFGANHIYEDGETADNDHAGTSLSLNTNDDKVADSYKIGDTHTLSLKKKSK